MEIKLKNTPEQVELIKAMGSKSPTVAREATEAVAAFINDCWNSFSYLSRCRI